LTDEDLDTEGEDERSGVMGGALGLLLPELRGFASYEPIKPRGGGDCGGDSKVQKFGPPFGDELADSDVNPSSSSDDEMFVYGLEAFDEERRDNSYPL